MENMTEFGAEAQKQILQMNQHIAIIPHMLITTNSGPSLSSHNASVFLMAVVTCVTMSLLIKLVWSHSGFNSMTVMLTIILWPY